MNQLPPTAPSLLVRLRDADDGRAWGQFVEVYSPLIYQFARRHGWQDADAADLMQDVLSSVAGGIRKFEYEPSRGLFRSWLFTIVRRKISDAAVRRRRHPEEQTAPAPASKGGTATEPAAPSAPDGEADLWEREYQWRLMQWGLDQIRGEFEESTWQAFLLTTLEGQSAKDASNRLGISVGAVYIAKSRVLTRLKERLQQIDETHPLTI